MNKTKLTLLFAALTCAAPLAGYAADVGVNARSVKKTFHQKADINPRDAGGTDEPANQVRTTGSRDSADVNTAKASGSTNGATTTTTTSQAMSDRNASSSAVATDPAQHELSALGIFSVIVLVALIAGFGFRSYRQRQHTV